MGQAITRPYNAINGAELAEIILHQMRKKMDDSGHFALQVTYPWIKNLKWTLEFTSYPREPETEKLSGEIPIETGRIPTEPQKTYQMTGELQGIGSEVSPDDVREQNEIGVPTPVRESTGIVERLLKAAGRAKK